MTSFDETIRYLEQWRAALRESLRQPEADAVALVRSKRECEAALRLLRFAGMHGIHSAMTVHRLPETPDCFGEYHLLWDADSGDPAHWREVSADGKTAAALPGDLLLCHTETSRRRTTGSPVPGGKGGDESVS